MVFTRVRRKSKNIALIGAQSRGKTVFQSWYGYMKYLKGSLVFSNYPLNYPHRLINTVDEIKDIRYSFDINQPKVALMDDFELWFNSRAHRSKVNIELNEILIFWGKINCSCVYSSKRGNVDIGLRDITDEFYWTNLILWKRIKDFVGVSRKLLDLYASNYLEFLAVKLEGFNSEGDELSTKYLYNLDKWVKLYDTQHMIKDIDSFRGGGGV